MSLRDGVLPSKQSPSDEGIATLAKDWLARNDMRARVRGVCADDGDCQRCARVRTDEEMANTEQLEILRKGREDWHKWRNENFIKEVDLSNANLKGISLSLYDFAISNLSGADLREAELIQTDLRGANLNGTNFAGAVFGWTMLDEVDLSNAQGLEEVIHRAPSTIGTNTLWFSKGKIAEKFLRGCGLRDWEIESVKLYQPGLSAKEIDDILYRVHDLRVGQAVQINPLFISYSHRDSAFVDKIENYLDEKSVRFWRDIHHATAGRLEKVVDRAMRQNPTVLLVISENSVQSDWVEHEARSARELEKELKRDVLCPVALDGAWKDCNWPVRLKEQIMEYNILDFSNWKDDAEFTKKFARLVEGLDLFYKE